MSFIFSMLHPSDIDWAQLLPLTLCGSHVSPSGHTIIDQHGA